MVARKAELIKLQDQIAGATGRDRDLDRQIGSLLDDPSRRGDEATYTASVDDCIALIGRVLPHWAWHVGYGPRGILPYATLHDEEQQARRQHPRRRPRHHASPRLRR